VPNYLHRIRDEYRTSVSTADLTEPEVNYIKDPNLSAVTGFAVKYWLRNAFPDDTVTLMAQAARDALDAAEDVTRLDGISDELDQVQTIMRAFAEVVLDEINNLRGQHGLNPRTLAQLKGAVRSKL